MNIHQLVVVGFYLAVVGQQLVVDLLQLIELNAILRSFHT